MRSTGATLVATASQTGRHPPTGHRTYDDYNGLLADGGVECVYIAVPTALHEKWVVAAADAGKHVLCEKPLAMTPEGAIAMARVCASAGVLLMEAYMTPFHPRTRLLWETIDQRYLGEVQHVDAIFTHPHLAADDHRLDPVLGCGVLVDLGIYCLEPIARAARWGPGDLLPRVAAAARTTSTGLETTVSAWLRFPSGVTGTVLCSFDAPDQRVLRIVGTEAAVRIDHHAFTPGDDDRCLTVCHSDGSSRRLQSQGGSSFLAMVEHFSEAVRGRARLARTAQDSVQIARLVAATRAAGAEGRT